MVPGTSEWAEMADSSVGLLATQADRTEWLGAVCTKSGGVCGAFLTVRVPPHIVPHVAVRTIVQLSRRNIHCASLHAGASHCGSRRVRARCRVEHPRVTLSDGGAETEVVRVMGSWWWKRASFKPDKVE